MYAKVLSAGLFVSRFYMIFVALSYSSPFVSCRLMRTLLCLQLYNFLLFSSEHKYHAQKLEFSVSWNVDNLLSDRVIRVKNIDS
jgi:Ca2+/Na+ antiporter